MKRGKARLPSIHYDISMLEDLVKLLEKDSGSSKVRIEVSDEDGIRTFTGIEELADDLLIPDRITRFRLIVQTDKGDAVISADTRRDSHSVTLEGDREWFASKKAEVVSYVNSNEYSPFRTMFNYRNRLGVALLAAGLIFSTQFQYILPWLGVPIYYHYPKVNYLYLVSGSTVLFVSLFLDKVYPYVVLYTEGPISKKGIKELIGQGIAVLGGASSIIAGAVTIWKYIT